MAQTLGVVHVLVSSQPSEDGLAQQVDQSMPPIPPRAQIG